VTRIAVGIDWATKPDCSASVVLRVDGSGKTEVLTVLSYADRQEIEKQLDDCLEVKTIGKDQGGPGYSQRDQDFLDSISEQWEEKGWLSDAQRDWLNDLHERIG